MSEGVARGQVRASGRTVADEAADEAGEDLLESIEEQSLDVERRRVFSSLSFSRMRTDWRPEQASSISRMHAAVSEVMLDRFAGAYRLMYEIYDAVREPLVDEDTGEVVVDEHGFPEWRRTESGAYVEDWSMLTSRQRENFLFQITTSLWEWQQDAADIWGEAMMAKSVWQESFSHHFDAEASGTVDARTARGNVASAEDRYFAVYASLLSRKAEALCRNMELLGQRTKDTMVQ